MKKYQCWLTKPLLAVSLAAAVSVAACNAQPQFINTDITGSSLTAPFTLKDLSGATVTMDSYKGKVVAMFFGYTNCPDVCPITLQQWAAVKQELGDKAKDLQVLFVSVDPERDTPELLAKYVPQFDPTFNALIGTTEEIKPLLAGLRVYSAKVEGKNKSNYLMDHTASSYVFDQQGRVRLLVRHNADAKPVIQDVGKLLDGK